MHYAGPGIDPTFLELQGGTLAPPEEDGSFSTICCRSNTRITPDLDVLIMTLSLVDYLMGWE